MHQESQHDRMANRCSFPGRGERADNWQVLLVLSNLSNQILVQPEKVGLPSTARPDFILSEYAPAQQASSAELKALKPEKNKRTPSQQACGRSDLCLSYFIHTPHCSQHPQLPARMLHTCVQASQLPSVGYRTSYPPERQGPEGCLEGSLF